MGSSCSCPSGTTNGGKCKHVIAMLLVYMKQQTTPLALPVAETHNEEVKNCSLEQNVLYIYTEKNRNTF